MQKCVKCVSMKHSLAKGAGAECMFFVYLSVSSRAS